MAAAAIKARLCGVFSLENKWPLGPGGRLKLSGGGGPLLGIEKVVW